MAQSGLLSQAVCPPFCLKGKDNRLGHFSVRKKPFYLNLSSVSKFGAEALYSVNSKAIEIPKQWYNLTADLPVKPPPYLHPKTFEPVKPEDLLPLFADELIKQEATNDRFIDIPEEVLDVYRLWRPTPLIRAKRLEKLLNTPARIYYKYEGVSPAGSHKANTAVPQVWYNAQQGVKNVVTETGAGQWGSALAFACALFGINCEVWQVRTSYDKKPYRKLMMETWGAKVHPSPSGLTQSGQRILEKDPTSPGSLGIAISEAVEIAAANADTKYCLGSVLNHVLLHQTVIGEECINQLEAFGETPDVIIGCTGGGSNFAGLVFPFIREKLSGKIDPIIRAVEPEACPSLTKGVYAYDYGDTAGMTPLMKMHTLGHDFVPDPIHAGGLRYHGMSPLVSHVYELGFIEVTSMPQTECFEGAIKFARSEGLIAAPEPAHAIAATIREALRCRDTGESKVIVMAMCGHGHFDLPSYDKYLQGSLVDLSFSEDKMQASLLPQVKPSFSGVMAASVPVIDIQDFPGQLSKLIEACEDWGCFRIVNFDWILPGSLMFEMKAVVKSLLELPEEIKRRNVDVIAGSGYMAPSQRNPLYEALGLYDMGNTEAVDSFCSKLDTTPHQRAVVLKYAKTVNELMMYIGQKMGEGLGLSVISFEKWICQFRINKYTFAPETVGSPGVQIHTDSSFLTILQDDEIIGGLEVKKRSGIFVAVDPWPETLLVNLGDIAAVWSNGRFLNVEHRVMCKEAGLRFSIASFLLGPKETMVETPPELIDLVHPRMYNPFMYQDYRELRMTNKFHSGEALWPSTCRVVKRLCRGSYNVVLVCYFDE